MKKNTLESKDSLVKKASYLRIIASDLADGMKNGNFKSLYRGMGIEFSGVRDYNRGDDIRSIDWNVTARMGKPFVKVFEEERELQIFIVVDSSLSMKIETSQRTKYEVAAETAALVTIAAEMNGCPVGAVCFDGKINFSSKPQLGREQTMLILTHLDKQPEEPVTGSALGSALNGAGQLLKKRSMFFVFSDFRSTDWEKPLISLAQKNDVIAVRIQNKMDSELPAMGAVPFLDAESGIKMVLPSSSHKLKKQWREFNEQHLARWQETCIKHGILPVVQNVSDEPLQVLGKIFSHKAQG